MIISLKESGLFELNIWSRLLCSQEGTFSLETATYYPEAPV